MLRRAVPFVLVVLVLGAGTAYASAPNDPGWSAQWHLRTIHADAAWARSKGAGIVVAIVDTGVDGTHPDLRGRIVSGRNFVDAPSGGDSNWQDEQGHGTFMAGLVSADTGNAEGVASVAPLAKIMPVRVLSSSGSGTPSDVVKGINWAVSHSADVINLSLAVESNGTVGGSSGLNLFGDSGLNTAINNAAAAGRVVVIAAGNNFTSSGGAPQTSYKASHAGVIVVGASTVGDKRAAYSNYGDGLDVLAPGGGSSSSASTSSCQSYSPVVSTWWNPSTGDSAYGMGCGTSMAVAHVSGIAALLMARGYSNSAAVSRIERTAKDLYAPGRDAESGWGRADAAAALGTTSKSGSHPKATPTTRHPRAATKKVGVAGTKPVVKGTKISRPPAPDAPASPVAGMHLTSAGPYGQPDDPRLRLFALALALSVGVAIAHTIARRADET